MQKLINRRQQRTLKPVSGLVTAATLAVAMAAAATSATGQFHYDVCSSVCSSRIRLYSCTVHIKDETNRIDGSVHHHRVGFMRVSIP
jgi:hypothetical protein